MTDKGGLWRGKTAVVTGAAGGIGEMLCLRLAQYGINMLITGRNAAKLAALSEKLGQLGVSVVTLSGDLRENAFLEEIIDTAVSRFGGIDLLINNAGQAHHGGIETVSYELYDAIMEVNVRAPFFLCKNALKYLRKSDCPTIINMCSASSHRGYPDQSVYVASKHALLGLSKTLASEVYQEDIRVHTVCPGGVFTDMVSLVRPDLTGTGMMQPEEIADIVAFLLENRRSNAVISEIRVNRCTKEPFT